MTIHIDWPQTIVLALMALDLILTTILHGKPKTGTYNVWASVISSALWFGLLYWGGFFR